MKRTKWLGVIVAGAVSAAGSYAHADDPPNAVVVPESPTVVVPESPPSTQQNIVVNSGEHVTERNTGSSGVGLIWGGATVFGASYAAAAITAALADDACKEGQSFCVRDRGILFIPVAGPFIALGRIDGTQTGASTAKALLAVDGAFQAGGIAMAITGAVLASRNASRHEVATRSRKVHFSPYATATGSGLSAMGRF
jgi:hypothetical protein